MKQKSKTQQVIDYIESGKPLTKLECYMKFKYWNLSDLICKLRKLHGPEYITTTMHDTVTDSEFAVYRLTNTNHLES